MQSFRTLIPLSCRRANQSRGFSVLPHGDHILPNYMVRILYLLLDSGQLAIERSARLSLLFSIIRIDPNPLRRKYLIFNAYIFVLICVLLVAQLFWICEHQRKWMSLKPPQCHIGLQVAIFQLVSMCPYMHLLVEYNACL